jgi:CDP-glucose 4,6-dehydratase
MGMTGAGLPDPSFWRDKRVLLTGHTGFKGSWAALWLSSMGAKVTGFGLAPDTEPALFYAAGVANDVTSIIGDLRDATAVNQCVAAAAPQIVIHMAAQAIVRRSIVDPVKTFATNVQGTVHLLEALRQQPELRVVLVVTSDKVYANDELGRTFVETDRLGGQDAYSASKAAAEIVTRAYASSYFEPAGIPVATARGGNVIGGGDFSADRLVPDVIRAAQSGKKLALRHPEATRPWQHVLDCVGGYFVFTEALANGRTVSPALNFGPDHSTMTVAELAEAIFNALGQRPAWYLQSEPDSIERATLAIDASRARAELGWRSWLAGAATIAWTADWYRAFAADEDLRAVTLGQIAAYCRAAA